MRRGAYRSYLLVVLTAILAASLIDRMVLGLALQDIKSDLDLSDTQLGILNGIAYSVFFSLMGVPISRWADRGNRVLLVSLTTATWSIAVAASAIAGNFAHLLLSRIGTAVGEAGCHPPVHSLVPDYYPRGERPRAMARYLLGGPIGIMIGYFAGGWLNELYGWRKTFLIIAVPGLVLAVLAACTLKDPRRSSSIEGSARAPTGQKASPESFRGAVRVLTASRTVRQMLFSWLVWCFSSWGMLQWLPAFLVRAHGLTSGEIGTWLAVVNGGGGLVATWLGGEWASRYAANNERLQLSVGAMLLLGSVVFYLIALLSPNHYLVMGAIAAGVFAQTALSAPIVATSQTLMPAHMRATGLALIIVLPMFVGMGFGPSTVGFLSDALLPWAGAESLRYALLLICPGWAWAAWHLWRARDSVLREIAHVQSHAAPAEEVNAVAKDAGEAAALR
jgi:MFS transporter, Spinster family, sphingosine-1-phosphate transporter